MKPRSHEDNQKLVCILCLSKTNLRKTSENQFQLIKTWYLPDFDSKRWYYPTAICGRCSFSLSDMGPILDIHVYEREPRVSTRSVTVCDCDVCKAARITLPNLSGTGKRAKKRGRPSSLEVSKKARAAKFCTVCFAEIARGKSHSCNLTERHKNLLQFLRGDKPRSGDSVVATYLREGCHDESGTITLSNIRGRPSQWTAGPSTVTRQPKLSVDDLFLLKKSCDLSTRKTILLSSALRGMEIEVPQNLPRELTKMNQKLKQFFSVRRITFDHGKDKKGSLGDTQPVVYCNDVKGLIGYAEHERNVQGDVIYKIGADGGGGSFKITLCIIEKRSSPVKSVKDTGVKKLFLLAVVPNIPEKYNNILQLWSLLRLDQLHAMIAGDLKVINLLLGIMGHSSTYPCPYCCASKVSLAKECGAPRTLRSITENHERWATDGSDEKKARDFFNCVQKPMLCGSPDTKTLFICPPPVLHIILGIVNCIYKAVEAVDEEAAKAWVKASACQRHSQYGFTGRNCHKLLDKRTLVPTDGPLGPFRTVLESFVQVFKACLQEALSADHRQRIEDFGSNWVKAGLPNSSKFHILRFHVAEFCGVIGEGLGRYGEQASETVHFDFSLTWAKLKVPESSDNYSDHLLHSVVLYNSSHL